MQSEGEAACVGLYSSQECVSVFVCLHTPEGSLHSCSSAALCLKFPLQQTVHGVAIQTLCTLGAQQLSCIPRMRIRPCLCSILSPFGGSAPANASSAHGKVTGTAEESSWILHTQVIFSKNLPFPVLTFQF